jgi:hypothetical protein
MRPILSIESGLDRAQTGRHVLLSHGRAALSPAHRPAPPQNKTTVVASLALASFFASLRHGACIAVHILRAFLTAALWLLSLPWRALCVLAASSAGAGVDGARGAALALLGDAAAGDRNAAPLPPDVRRELQRLLDAALEQPHTLLSPSSRNARALRRVSARVQQLQREHDERRWRERRAERLRRHERALRDWERERARRRRRHEQEVERWERRRRQQEEQQEQQPLPPRPAPPPEPSPPASPPASPPPGTVDGGGESSGSGAPMLLRLPWQLVLLHQRLEAAVTAMPPDQLHALLGGGNPQPAGLTDAEVRRLPRAAAVVGGGKASAAAAADDDESQQRGCCPICLCALRGADKLTALPACGHTLHLGCARKWLARRGECPVCRSAVLPPPPMPPVPAQGADGGNGNGLISKAAAAEAAMSARRARARAHLARARLTSTAVSIDEIIEEEEEVEEGGGGGGATGGGGNNSGGGPLTRATAAAAATASTSSPTLSGGSSTAGGGGLGAGAGTSSGLGNGGCVAPSPPPPSLPRRSEDDNTATSSRWP